MDIPATPLSTETPPVELDGERLRIDGLEIEDPTTVGLARDREALGERLDELVAQMVEIGARVLEREQATAEADYVRVEFERQARDLEENFDARAKAVSAEIETRLEAVFGEEAGMMARLMERHFGDDSSAAVQNRVRELVRELLADQRQAITTQFTADDPSNPLAQFQKASTEAIRTAAEAQAKQLIEMQRTLAELRSRLEAASAEEEKEAAVAAEAEKGTAKGRSYEEQVAEALDAIAHGRGDIAEPVGEKVEGGGKKGDVLVEIDAQAGPSRGRIAFEAKDSRLGRPDALRTLDKAREQRSAAFAVLVVPSDEKVPARSATLEEIHGDKMIVTYDPGEDSALALETAYALARARVLMAQGGGEVDAATIADAAERALATLGQVTQIKRSLTTAKNEIDKSSGNVEAMATALREQLDEIAAQTRPAEGDAEAADGD